MSSRDYPRMLFHRTKEPVTVQSREEEDALGREWSRIIWPASAIAAPEPAPPAPKPVPPSDGYSEAEPDNPEPDPAIDEPEPEEEHAPRTPLRRLARALHKPAKKKKG